EYRTPAFLRTTIEIATNIMQTDKNIILHLRTRFSLDVSNNCYVALTCPVVEKTAANERAAVSVLIELSYPLAQ
ncbi:hypothetical protein, partial [Paenibacillus prosopidis]|uniref:hypothetical protein n=1 Tax=Paenibacillus prosopidis TaxID=630520 RepID=UPI001C6960C2